MLIRRRNTLAKADDWLEALKEVVGLYL